MKPAEVELKEIFKFAGFKKYDKVWDFGCGIHGRMVAPLSKAGCICYFTDKDFGSPPESKVDKFLLFCVLHYNNFYDKQTILFKAYDQLKPGGHIIIIEPNPRNPFFYCLYFWRWLTKSKTERRYHNEKFMLTRKQLVRFLVVVGFKNIETKKYAWLPSKFRLLWLNKILNKIPIINTINAFNWIKAER